jgi:predicted alpha-1,2-mannosidase
MKRRGSAGAAWFMRVCAGAGIAAIAASPGCASRGEPGFPYADDDSAVTRPTADAVSPLFIGSGGFAFGFGSAFPGACAPQGLAKVGPDTSGRWGRVNFLHYSGYWYGDDTVVGFSHLHLHGTGAQDYGVLGVMPLAAAAFDTGKRAASDYASPFAKRSERAVPGRYEVTLDASGVRAELTATTHGAHHRYTYPAGAAAGTLLLDLDHRLSGTVDEASLELDPDGRTIRGQLLSKGGMSSGFGGVRVHFVVRARAPWSRARVWSATDAPAEARAASGAKVGAALDFTFDGPERVLELQVGLSLVSIEGAEANLAAELPAFDFEGTARATADAWAALTGAITFEGATPEEEAMREAALVHAFLMPTVVSDVDGRYRAFEGSGAHRASFPVVSDLSLWDTYRTLHPLYALIAPARAAGAVNSLVAMHEDLGYFPKWPIGTGEAGTMLGSSADVVVADAHLRGVPGIDAVAAYAKLRALALDGAGGPRGLGGREHTRFMDAPGYVPASVGRSVSWTIEYGHDDYALANLAESLGRTEDAARLRTRMRGWRKLFDPADGFLWSKGEDGTWATSHGDPAVPTDEYAEANPWQTVVGPLFDVDGLVSAFGSREALVAKVRELFVLGKAEYDATNWRQEYSAGQRRSYFWAANEPDIHAAYLFALAGRPDLTQKWVRWVDAQMFTAGADGLPGNDDGGTMSAWLLFDWLGFYPIAGSDLFVIGAPKFPRARVAVPGGLFTVEARGVSPQAIYVQSASIDGVPLERPLLRHAQIRAGSTLRFVMGERPSTWGR